MTSSPVDPYRDTPDGAPVRGLRLAPVAPASELDWPRIIADHVHAVEDFLDAQLKALAASWQAQMRGSLPVDVDPPALLRDLIGRGGKRTRPIMTFAGWVASGAADTGTNYPVVVQASAAMELLHAFALIHDDVMDESRVRRGRPSLQLAAAGAHERAVAHGRSDRFGENIAILTGDLAHAEADRLAAELPPQLQRIWRQLVLELVAGQLCDLTGSAAADRRLGFARDVVRQKTGNYTVARPLQLGAAAGGAGEETLAVLGDYGRHAGEAFGLRDEILGIYGDPDVTGKPADDDLRAGKPTVLMAVAAQQLHGAAREALDRVGSAGMRMDDARIVREAMTEQGVLARVETMIEERVADALVVLRPDAVSPAGLEQLTRMVTELAHRGH